MEIEFDCGIIVKNVGELKMALQHHLTICEDPLCNDDVRKYLAS